MSSAGLAAGVALLLTVGVVLSMASLLPLAVVRTTGLIPAAQVPQLATSRLLSEQFQPLAESDSPAVKKNRASFVVPQWKSRCDLNRTKFVPECLPEPVFKRGAWLFAEFCGVEYAAAKVSNQRPKASAHAKVFELMYDNVTASMSHFIAGMATTGIFLRRRRRKEEGSDCEEAPVTMKTKVIDLLYLAFTTGSLLYAVSACLLATVKFCWQASEYFSGVWMLPPHATSYQCKSILFQEFLYYKDLLGCLTLTSFTIMDLYVTGVLYDAWFGLTAHFCCVCAVCQPLITCFSYIFSWVWCPAFVACLKYVFTCRCLCDMCSACCGLLKACCSYMWWLYCQCGCCKELHTLCASCANCCSSLCWTCGFHCSHCSCVVCCNNCVWVKLILWLLVTIILTLLFLPLPVYLLLGLLAYAVSVLAVVLLLLVPVLMCFWAVTQAVTATCMVKELCCKSDDPPEFMSPFEYYKVYATELLVQVLESLERFLPKDQKSAEQLRKKTAKEHPSLPEGVKQALSYMEQGSEDNRVVNFFRPIELVLSLIVGSAITSGGTLSLMHLLGGHYDLTWSGDQPKLHLSDDRLRHGNLTTVAGVRVPEQWPTITGVGFQARCTCLQCNNHTLLTEISDSTTCAPAKLPGRMNPLACQADHVGDGNVELTAESSKLLLSAADVLANDLPPFDGLGQHGHVRCGRQRYVGLGIKLHPVFLNTYKLKVDHRPRSGCYGVLLADSGDRLNGWCNCSSGKFVPTAIDVVYAAPLWPFRKDFQRLDMCYLVSARDYVHPMQEQEWIEQMKVYMQEEFYTYESDRTLGFHFLDGLWSCWLQGFWMITDMLTAIFRTFYSKWVLLTKHFLKTCHWLVHEFYALGNFVLALSAWLHSGDLEDFQKVATIVIFSRSVSSLMMGLAKGIVKLAQKSPYELLTGSD